NLHVVKLGINYKVGADPWAGWGAPVNAYPVKALPRGWSNGWEFDFGARYWYSSGRFQKDLLPPTLVSRLTYDKTTAHSGELFGRIDSPWNVFVKGNVGLGKITSGRMNDEDWLIELVPNRFIPYTNTLSDQRDGRLNYATIDLGYDMLRGPGYKV